MSKKKPWRDWLYSPCYSCYCKNEYEECGVKCDDLKFGTGIGFDNVISCPDFECMESEEYVQCSRKKGVVRMKFEVIYEQIIKQQARFEVKVENETELIGILEKLDMDLRAMHSERLDDIKFALLDRGIAALDFEEEYYSEGECPEYYDHNEVKE